MCLVFSGMHVFQLRFQLRDKDIFSAQVVDFLFSFIRRKRFCIYVFVYISIKMNIGEYVFCYERQSAVMFENIKRCGTRCTICTVNFFIYIRMFLFIVTTHLNLFSLYNKKFSLSISVLKILRV